MEQLSRPWSGDTRPGSAVFTIFLSASGELIAVELVSVQHRSKPAMFADIGFGFGKNAKFVVGRKPSLRAFRKGGRKWEESDRRMVL